MFWPTKPTLPKLPEKREPAIPTFLEATAALASVRHRLAAGDLLGDAERKAIDTLQLALTAGSDK